MDIPFDQGSDLNYGLKRSRNHLLALSHALSYTTLPLFVPCTAVAVCKGVPFVITTDNVALSEDGRTVYGMDHSNVFHEDEQQRQPRNAWETYVFPCVVLSSFIDCVL